MASIRVRLSFFNTELVDVTMPAAPRVGESVAYSAVIYPVESVTWQTSDDDYEVFVYLGEPTSAILG